MKFFILKIAAIFFICSVAFQACENEFSINDEWQDITIVYGLLNRSDTAQYVKINKAFLGDGDVFEMAEISDSIQYNTVLDVSLVEYKLTDENLSPYYSYNWEQTNRTPIKLSRTDEIPKDEGVFGIEKNYLYKTTESISDGYKYIVEIENPDNGKHVWAETFMINRFIVSMPLNSDSYQVNMANEGNPFKTEWKSAVYGKIYETDLQFNYIEVLNGDTSIHNVIFNYEEHLVNEVREPNEPMGLEMSQEMGGVDFYQRVARGIEENTDAVRIAIDLDFIYHIGGQSYSTYLSVSTSASSYGQSSAAYSNIKNGKGLFDCRYLYKREGVKFHRYSIDSLSSGRFTKHLNFVNFTFKE